MGAQELERVAWLGRRPFQAAMRRAGHLSGALPEPAERALLLAFTATSLLFAGRKYTQAIKDDIGDKSVFM